MDFILRKWQESDVDSVAYYCNNKKIADNLRDGFPFPYTQEHAEYFVKTCMEADDNKDLYFAIDVGGKAVGSIGIFKKDGAFRNTGELGYWLGEEYWGKGIMTEAIKRICKIGFEKLDIVRIYAEPFSHNKASQRVLEKAGFELEGVQRKGTIKDGIVIDACIYSKII